MNQYELSFYCRTSLELSESDLKVEFEIWHCWFVRARSLKKIAKSYQKMTKFGKISKALRITLKSLLHIYKFILEYSSDNILCGISSRQSTCGILLRHLQKSSMHMCDEQSRDTGSCTTTCGDHEYYNSTYSRR